MKKTMKKLILGVVLGISVLGFTGVGFVEAVEYFQVAKNNVAESVQENIPVGVEIDRMQVILNKLDKQVGQQKYEVAKVQVALEDAEARLSAKKEWCQNLLADMSKLPGWEPVRLELTVWWGLVFAPPQALCCRRSAAACVQNLRFFLFVVVSNRAAAQRDSKTFADISNKS